MDTQARIEAAKDRLDRNKAALVRVKEAGPPCIECRYFIPRHSSDPATGRIGGGPFCGHLAYTTHLFDPVRGNLSQEIQVQPEKARADDGLCGFEAILFEPRDGFLASVKRNLPDILRFSKNAFYWVGSSSIFGLILYAWLLRP